MPEAPYVAHADTPGNQCTNKQSGHCAKKLTATEHHCSHLLVEEVVGEQYAHQWIRAVERVRPREQPDRFTREFDLPLGVGRLVVDART